MNKKINDKFISSGYLELLKASKDRIALIKKEINYKYKEELNSANPIKIIYLKIKIYKEIKKEIDKIVPPDAFYLKNKAIDKN